MSATSQDSSWHSEAAWDQMRGRAHKAEAERDEALAGNPDAAVARAYLVRAERAETALKELAEEFERRAESAGRQAEAPLAGYDEKVRCRLAEEINARAAIEAREKAAKLKEGEQ